MNRKIPHFYQRGILFQRPFKLASPTIIDWSPITVGYFERVGKPFLLMLLNFI